MRVVVAAASRHGSTNEIAEAIGAALRDAGLDVDVHRIEDLAAVDAYDAAVIGSAVYVGKWLEPAKAWIERNADWLRAHPTWLFSSGPLGDPPKPVEDPVDVAPIAEKVGARGHRVFSGELAKDDLGFGERAIVGMVRAPYGDFRDWDAIRSWASEIANALESGAG